MARLRQCKKCGRYFRTPFKHSTVFLECYGTHYNHSYRILKNWTYENIIKPDFLARIKGGNDAGQEA